VNVTGAPVPVANYDYVQIINNFATVVPVLNNDANLGTRPVSVASVTQGTHGVVKINADNTVTYTPTVPNYIGSDTFSYTISDATAAVSATFSSTAIVHVSYVQIPLPPVTFTATPTAVSLSVPGYPNAVIYYTTDGHTIPTTASTKYSPATPLAPPVSTTIIAYATTGFRDSAFSSYTFGDALAPMAVPDVFQVQEVLSADAGADNTLNVLANDNDPQQKGLTIVSTTLAKNGSVNLAEDGTLHYVPNAGFYGIDAFSYTIEDGLGVEATATVTVFVNQIANNIANNNPSAVDQAATLGYDATKNNYALTTTVNLLANDSDPDNDALTVYSITQPTMGTAVINADGTIAYTRDPSKFGSDSFTYTITDGNGGYATANVTVDQVDTDGISIPDAWQQYNFGYVGIDPNDDPDGDGLPNLAEYQLHTDPKVADNPLNLAGVSLPIPLPGTVEIPLRISPNVDSNAVFELYVDGAIAKNAYVEKRNGVWIADWNAITTPNGLHNLSLRYYCHNLSDTLSDTSLIMNCVGDSLTVNVNNMLTLTALSSSVGNSLVIDATVNNGASSYSINVYDADDYAGSAHPVLLHAMNGTVSGNKIEDSWDLTDGDPINPTIISTGPVTCEVTLFGGMGGSVANIMAHPNAGGTPAGFQLLTLNKFLGNPGAHNFVLAWGLDDLSNYRGNLASPISSGMNFAGTILNDFFDIWDDPSVVYNILPSGGSGNVNNPGGANAFQLSTAMPGSEDQLKQALGSSANFFWRGHGSQYGIDTSSLVVKATDIAGWLGNPAKTKSGALEWQKPYSLVILFCCSAYSQANASAFGITDFTDPRTPMSVNADLYVPPDINGVFGRDGYLDSGRSKSTVLDYIKQGKTPQAFVGWPVGLDRAQNASEVNKENTAISDHLFFQWQNTKPSTHYTIYEVMWEFSGNLPQYSDARVEADAVACTAKWELSGCRDLRVTDR